MTSTEILKARVTPETKARVAEITRAELLAGSVWLRRLVDRAIWEQARAAGLHRPIPRERGARQMLRRPGTSSYETLHGINGRGDRI